MNKKGAVSLSMSALVIIIISIFVLAMGITLLFKFVSKSQDVKQTLDSRTEMEIENLLLAKGQKVVLPLATKSIQSGEKAIFGIGVLNINDADEFRLEIELSRYQDEGKIEQTGDEIKSKANGWLLYSSSPFTLTQNENTKVSVLVKVDNDAPKGKYIYNARIYDSVGGQYGNTQKFIVIVT